MLDLGTLWPPIARREDSEWLTGRCVFLPLLMPPPSTGLTGKGSGIRRLGEQPISLALTAYLPSILGTIS